MCITMGNKKRQAGKSDILAYAQRTTDPFFCAKVARRSGAHPERGELVGVAEVAAPAAQWLSSDDTLAGP